MEKVKRTIDTAYIVLFFASVSVTLIGLVFSRTILVLLKTPAEVLPSAQTYLNIMFIGMIVMFGYNSISAILRGLGDSKTPLYFLIISTVINIVLDIIFVLVFRWGVAGAAWATVIAQACSFGFGIYYLNKTSSVFKFNPRSMVFDKEIFFASLRIGLPSGIQQMLFSLGMIALQALVNTFGTNTVAAYTAGTRIDSFATMPIMTFGMAISTFVGQNLGANKPERVRKGYITTLIMGSLISIGVTIFIYLFGNNLVALFNKDPEVIEVGSRYLRIVSTFYIAVCIMFVTTGVLRGAGDTIVPMIISLLSLWLIRVPAAWLLSSRMGTDGIWWSIPAGWTMGLILSVAYYLTGRWKKRVVVKERRVDMDKRE